MDKFEKGTILYDLQPYCNALLPLMRDEKDKKGTTYQEISDITGITMDNIKRFYTGEHKQPSVYKIAALCRYFGLSMDALFGLTSTDKIVAHTELEKKDAEIEALKAKIATQADEYERRLATYQSQLADMKADKAALVESLHERAAQMAEKEAEYKHYIGEMKNEYHSAMSTKKRTITTLSIALGIIVVLLIALLVADNMFTHIGWIRF